MLNKKLKKIIELNKQAYENIADIINKEIQKHKKELFDVEYKKLKFFLNTIETTRKQPIILDIGCGVGYILDILLQINPRIFYSGIDISNNMIAICKNQFEKLDNVSFIKDNFLTHNFSWKFDGIIMYAFIHLFPKKQASIILRRALSLLNSNGILLISTSIHDVPSEGIELKSKFKEKRYRARYTEEELLQLVKDFELLKKFINADVIKSNNKKKWITFILKKNL